jgi:hypothetical protein
MMGSDLCICSSKAEEDKCYMQRAVLERRAGPVERFYAGAEGVITA